MTYKKIFASISALLLALAPLHECHADLDQVLKDNESNWGPGTGSQESTETSIATSMIWWGVGLTVGIAILVALLHTSSGSSSSSASN